MSEKVALLVNLGSPDSPAVGDVRRYLNQFLMDPDVIDLPWITRRLLVSLFILPFRAPKSASAYREIWTEKGSPLLVNCADLLQKVAKQTDIPVYMAMRYGSPSIEQTLLDLHEQHPKSKKLVVLPLYPHYAGSTVKSSLHEINRVIEQFGLGLEPEVIAPFYDHPEYIDALIASARPWIDQPFTHLLFSYHGIPERHIKREDPTGSHCLKPYCCQTPSVAHATCYRYQTLQTTKAFVQKAGIAPEKYSVAFQSRLGRAKWLEPYTDQKLVELAKQGIKRLLVICPAFTADCLETIEEIGIRGRESFMEAGGEEMILIPCLNSHPAWVTILSNWLSDKHESNFQNRSDG